MEALDLVEQLADARRLRRRAEQRDRAVHPVGPQQDEVADLARLDPVVKLVAGVAMPAHQTDADLEVLLLGFLAQLEHLSRARPVHRDRLLHEDVDPLVDGVGEMDPAERRRRRQDHHVARPQAIHRFLIAVEADELAFLRHVDLLGDGWVEVFVEVLVAAREPIREDIGHGHQLDRAFFDGQGIGRRPGAAAAAADQCHLDRIALGSVNVRHRPTSQGRRHSDLAGVLQQLAARLAALCGLAHNMSPHDRISGCGKGRSL